MLNDAESCKEKGAKPMAKNLDEIMTLEEMAGYLKIGKSTLYNMVREDKIPAVKIANQWRFRKEEIDKWLQEIKDRKNYSFLNHKKSIS